VADSIAQRYYQGAQPPVPASVQAAIPGLEVIPMRRPFSNVGGYVEPADPGMKMHVNLDSENGPRDKQAVDTTMYHEADHLMAKRQRGHPYAINKEYDSLANGTAAPRRRELVERLANAGDYLGKTYGVKSGYLDPEMVRFQGSLAHNLLAEQLADLSALQQAKGVDVVNEPHLAKHVFDTPAAKEIVASLMGLRQTRLDAKDLQPYTPLSKQPKSTLGRQPDSSIAASLMRYLGRGQ
jgi:hypothetical protein